jgi:hypothetical protein
MDGEDLLGRVRTRTDTELSRLGSEKLLLAATDATLEPDAVAGALLTDIGAARDRLEVWGGRADAEAVAAALSDGAARVEHLEGTVAKAWPEATVEKEGLLANLEDPGSPSGRAGAGLLGLPLVLDRLLLQSVSFHVNEANTGAADRLREARDGLREIREEAVGSSVAATPNPDAAVADAVAVIAAAYDTYESRLEAMGLDPKPLC